MLKISKSPALWWQIDGFIRIANFIVEKYYDDNFEFTYIDTRIDNSTLVETSETRRHVFNGETVETYINGVLSVSPPISLGDIPQFSDNNSFFSNDYDYTTIIDIPNCPPYTAFNASLSNSANCPTVNISCDCKVITFNDTSNYETNT